MPRLALVSCVRDEARFLRTFLAYHRALGVERAYLYLDRCTDASPDVAREFAWVDAISRDRRPGSDLVRYQMQAADDALARARADGMDWLLSIDVDEYAWGDGTGPTALVAGDLRRLLARARGDTEAVVLRTLEVVPARLPAGASWCALRHVLDTGTLSRAILDPATGRERRFDGWIGHRLGKSAVRVAADVQAGTPHVWTRRQGSTMPDLVPVPTEPLGLHFHFVVVDAEHWRAKYRKLAEDPPIWPRGAPVAFPKQSWKEAAARMTPAEAAAYFERWIAVPDDVLSSSPDLAVRTDVRDVLRTIGA
jgi:hypothetical protein